MPRLSGTLQNLPPLVTPCWLRLSLTNAPTKRSSLRASNSICVPPTAMMQRPPRQAKTWRQRHEPCSGAVALPRQTTRKQAQEALPASVRMAIAKELAVIDPQAEILLDLSCPTCGNQWQGLFDIVSFLWAEIRARARRLLQEVDTLARAYGWAETDILGMSETHDAGARMCRWRCHDRFSDQARTATTWGIPTIQPRIPALYAPVADETTFRTTNETDYKPVLRTEQEPAVGNQRPGRQGPTIDPTTSLAPLVTSPSLQQQPLRHKHLHRTEPVESVKPKPEPADKPSRLTKKNGFDETEVQPKLSPLDSTIRHSPDIFPSKGQLELRANESPSTAAWLVVPSKKTPPIPPPRLVEQRASGHTVTSKRRTSLPGQAPPRLAPDHLQHEARGAAQPPVHVTIGRIEVTAVTAAPATRGIARKPSMSLDDYLARQRRGNGE